VDAEPRPVSIRELRVDDWPAVRAIYEEGIRAGDATFETETPSWERWDAAHPQLRLVAEHDGAVVGWAALSPASSRQCYRGVGEVSVYVAEASRGAGIGRALLAELVERYE
jgi:L-amino acid N-acyltransferase YncA